MKKYFQIRNSTVTISASPEQITIYRDLVVAEMEKMGATQKEIAMLHAETILNSIRNNRKPEDVAWAVLQ